MKKFFIVISLLLCTTLFFTGCGKSSEQAGTDNITAQISGQDKEKAEEKAEEVTTLTEDGKSEAAEVKNPGEFESITDMSEYWNDLYTSNEEVLNAYEGMPIMALVTPGLCFVTGVQYDILNINNENGRFEGDLMLAGYPAFVEKSGSKLTFGYEEVLEEDTFTSKMGDKKAESGNCDLEKGYYFAEAFTERAGAVISRSVNEFVKQSDGDMCALVVEGNTLNYNGEESLKTSYIFIRSGKDQYDFVVANSEIGTAYELLHLEADMTKDQAKEMFEAAGAVVENSGGIADGKFYVE